MGGGTRRMAPEARRTQLLDVLADLVLAEGYTAVSIDRVAREAGIARTVVYAQFGNLQGLLEALVERTERRAVEQVQAIVTPTGDRPAPRDVDGLIVGAVLAFGEVVLADPRTWRLTLLPSDGAPPVLKARTEAARDTIRGIVQPVVARLIDIRGGAADVDDELTTRAIVTLGEDAAKLMMSDPDAYPPERMAAFASALVSALHRSAARR